MIWATITLLFIVILYPIMCKDENNERNRKKYIIVCGIILVLFAASKEIKLDTDPYRYMLNYELMGKRTYESIWNGYLNGELKDGLYYITAKFFYDIGIPFRLYITFIAALYTYSVGSFIYRYSLKPYISIALWFSLTWFAFSLSGFRQTIAMSLIMIAYLQAGKKHLLRAYLLIVPAALIHTSSMIFIPFFFINKLKIGKKTFVILTVISVFLPRIVEGQFRKIMSIFSWNATVNQYMETESSTNWTGYVIQLAVLIFCYLAYDEVCEKNPQLRGIYSLSTFGLLLQPFSQLIAEMFRVSMYYSIFSIVLVPHCFCVYKKEQQPMVEKILTVVIFAYLFISGKYAEYSLCW